MSFREPYGLPIFIARSTKEADFHLQLFVPPEGGWRWAFQQHMAAANEKAEGELWAERRSLNTWMVLAVALQDLLLTSMCWKSP